MTFLKNALVIGLLGVSAPGLAQTATDGSFPTESSSVSDTENITLTLSHKEEVEQLKKLVRQLIVQLKEMETHRRVLESKQEDIEKQLRILKLKQQEADERILDLEQQILAERAERLTQVKEVLNDVAKMKAADDDQRHSINNLTAEIEEIQRMLLEIQQDKSKRGPTLEKVANALRRVGCMAATVAGFFVKEMASTAAIMCTDPFSVPVPVPRHFRIDPKP